MSTKDFYRAFEEKHRGSRALIKKRVSLYLPFVHPLKEIYSDVTALDIGCGRGEWLEILKENDISAQGIDFDENMLEACHEFNLDVLQGDGIGYLKKQADASIHIISAFHVVEHISFEALQTLVQESLRILKPGGILIMETPNPENIKVATENFYLDPTHIKPIPSGLLSFLPEFYGFSRTKVLKLQECIDLNHEDRVNLLQVIEGVSPDYAVVTQKKAVNKDFKLFDKTFSKEYGLSLSMLTDQFENRLLNIEAKATQAEAKATQAEAKATQAEAKATQAEAKATQAEADYHLLLHSNSWKVTKPLRVLVKFTRWFFTGVKHWITFSPSSRPRRMTKKTLTFLKHQINTNPKLKIKIINILNHFPGLKEKLKKVANTPYHSNETFINKYRFEAPSPRTKSQDEQQLSIDEILQRVQSEIEKEREAEK